MQQRLVVPMRLLGAAFTAMVLGRGSPTLVCEIDPRTETVSREKLEWRRCRDLNPAAFLARHYQLLQKRTRICPCPSQKCRAVPSAIAPRLGKPDPQAAPRNFDCKLARLHAGVPKAPVARGNWPLHAP